MYDSGKIAQIAAEMRNYSLTILGISEARWTGSGLAHAQKAMFQKVYAEANRTVKNTRADKRNFVVKKQKREHTKEISNCSLPSRIRKSCERQRLYQHTKRITNQKWQGY